MTNRILAIDTTSDFGSLALAEGGGIVEEILLHSTEGFADILFGQIRALLDRHGWTLDSIGVYAAAAGPGSFTGVRVGLSAAKGLADAMGRPVAAVSNLRAMASFGTVPLRAPFYDARRGDIFGAVYDAAGVAVAEETVAKFSAWLPTLPPDVEFVTPDVPIFQAALPPGAVITPCPRGLAAAVARLAARGETLDPVAADANYVRRSDAELFWTDSR